MIGLLLIGIIGVAAAFSQADQIGSLPVDVETRLGVIRGREGIFLEKKVRSFLSNLTVMVWLFGGGYYSGSPSLILYDGRVCCEIHDTRFNQNLGPCIDGQCGCGECELSSRTLWISLFRPSRRSREHGNARSAIGLAMDSRSHLFIWWKSRSSDSIRRECGSVEHCRSSHRSGITETLQTRNPPIRESRQQMEYGHPSTGSDKEREVGRVGWMQSDHGGVDESSIEILNRSQIVLRSKPLQVLATITCLREAEPTKLVDMMWNVDLNFLEFPFVIVSRDRHFFRHKDGFEALRRGDFTKGINLMFGINHDEGNFWNIYNLPEFFNVPIQPELSREEFYQCVDKAFAAQPEVVRHAAKFVYSDPHCNGTGKRKFYAEQVNQMVGDYFFTCDSIWLADRMATDPSNSASVYVYYFDQDSSANPWPQWTGVMHGYEIEFVFGVPLYNKTAQYTRREEIFSKKIIEYWTSFATTGVPVLLDGKNHAAWPKYDLITKRWMNLKAGSHLSTIHAKKSVECELWRHSRDIEYTHYEHAVLSSSSTTATPYTVFSLLVIVLFRRLL